MHFWSAVHKMSPSRQRIPNDVSHLVGVVYTDSGSARKMAFSSCISQAAAAQLRNLISYQISQKRGSTVLKRKVSAQLHMRSWRKVVWLLAMSTVIAICAQLFIRKPRSLWIRPRSSHWWKVVLSNFRPYDWLENFRMSRETFQYLISSSHL